MSEPRAAYQVVREAARVNEDVLGLVLTGSRGKDARFVHPGSDYDFALFVRDDALAKYREQFGELPAGARLYLFTLDAFRETLVWRGMLHWQRYTWARLKVAFDRSGGEVQRLLDAAAHVPADHLEDHIRQSLRWYFSQVYHSLKNHQRGDAIGHQFEAAESIRPFLEAVFALHGGRVMPYFKYLCWEIEQEPLDQLPLATDALLAALTRIRQDGDVQTQQQLLRAAQAAFTPAGYGDYFSWYNVNFTLNYPQEVDPVAYRRAGNA